MISLAGHSCLNHPSREAVARCPGCGQMFCRECVTEHDDRVLCAACLRKQSGPVASPSRVWPLMLGGVQVVTGCLVAWLMFYVAARMLLVVPADFHDGTVWKESLFEE
jgi:hypothetical protein